MSRTSRHSSVWCKHADLYRNEYEHISNVCVIYIIFIINHFLVGVFKAMESGSSRNERLENFQLKAIPYLSSAEVASLKAGDFVDHRWVLCHDKRCVYEQMPAIRRLCPCECTESALNICTPATRATSAWSEWRNDEGAIFYFWLLINRVVQM